MRARAIHAISGLIGFSNLDQKSCWITLAPGTATQVIQAERVGEQRVYVAAEETQLNTIGFMIVGQD